MEKYFCLIKTLKSTWTHTHTQPSPPLPSHLCGHPGRHATAILYRLPSPLEQLHVRKLEASSSLVMGPDSSQQRHVSDAGTTGEREASCLQSSRCTVLSKVRATGKLTNTNCTFLCLHMPAMIFYKHFHLHLSPLFLANTPYQSEHTC